MRFKERLDRLLEKCLWGSHFRGFTRISSKDPLVSALAVGSAAPEGVKKIERLLEYLKAALGDFDSWRVVVVTDAGLYVNDVVTCVDRNDVAGGHLVVKFKPMNVRRKVNVYKIVIHDAQMRCVSVGNYIACMGRGDVLNLDYNLKL